MVKKYIRGREGVLASLSRSGDFIRLNLDDAESNKVELPKQWKTITPYTSVEFDTDKLLNLELSEREYAMIGENIVARLVAVLKSYE